MSDRGAEGAFVLRALDVDVYPLMVTREVGKGVDCLLGYFTPCGWAHLLPDQSGLSAGYRIYATADGERVAVAALDDQRLAG